MHRLTGILNPIRARTVLASFVFLFCAWPAAEAQTWTQLTVTGGPPDPRSSHTAVYAQASNRMIVFGGRNPFGFTFVPPSIALRNDVWVLSNADGTEASAPAWTALNPIGGPPSRRTGASSVYDRSTNRMIVFGGNPNEGFCEGQANDVWVLSNADGTDLSTPAWTLLSPAGTPPNPRWLHSAGFDPANNRMMVFGGAINGGCTLVVDNNLYILLNANGSGGIPLWTMLTPSGTPPFSNEGNGAGVYDPATNRLIVVNGSNASGIVDVRVLTNANGLAGTPAWIGLSPTGGPPTTLFPTAASLVYDPASNRLIVFGGIGSALVGISNVRLNEVWALSNANGMGPSTPAWTKLSPTGGPPLGRDSHTAVFNPTTNRMTVFAGRACVSGGPCTSESEFSSLNDVWVLTNANGLSQNTPAGTNVKVTPVDTTTGTAPATLTFSNVTQAGTTSLTSSGTGSPPPLGFKLGSPPTYYNLSTTAVFSGSIMVCINYTGISFSKPSNLKLFHLEGGIWVNQTVSNDTVNQIICASVSSLSPFAIFEGVPLVSLSATSLNFGNQVISSTSAVQTVTLSNAGGATLNITSVASSANFAQTNTCGASVAAGGSCTLSVTFTPTAVGSRTGAITLTDDAGDSPQSISLSGTGQYNICALYDQTRSVKGGAVFPIKLQLCDANGNDLSSSSIVVHATSVTMVSGSSATPDSAGNANPDNDFRFDPTLGLTGGYIFNLSTTGLASGTYSLQFTATGDPVTHSVNFGVR